MSAAAVAPSAALKAAANGQAAAAAAAEKEKRKKRKKRRHGALPEVVLEKGAAAGADDASEGGGVEVEYVAPHEQAADPAFAAFADVFKFFAPPEQLCNPVKAEAEAGDVVGNGKEGEKEGEEDESSAAGEKGGEEALYDENGQRKPTKKERKELKRRKIAILKQHVARPELVELHDANSADPLMLLYLKAYRNTVPVPRHWSQKRRYLQCKRGQEKAPFQLPEFIAQTGISKLRAAYEEKQAAKNAKTKQRERMAPKMHRMDIDYQVLHDAFFKFQTKPKLTAIGDVYYEGKELEVRPKNKRPGELSDELKRALGMPPGAPPPWLVNMQRYGPPPSYPALKVPGLNAPIPAGAHWGYHPGGWGKPPVDEQGRPLYGDVFGLAAPEAQVSAPVNRTKWGEVMEEEEEEEESEEEEAADAGEKQEGAGGAGGAEAEEEADLSGIQTSESGVSSMAPGLETPDAIDLRKGKAGEPARPLFQVLPQTDASVGGAVYGSAHRYVVPSAKAAAAAATGGAERVELMKSQRTEKLSVAIDPAEMEGGEGLSEALLKEKYAKALSQAQGDDDEERKRKRKKEAETRKFKF